MSAKWLGSSRRIRPDSGVSEDPERVSDICRGPRVTPSPSDGDYRAIPESDRVTGRNALRQMSATLPALRVKGGNCLLVGGSLTVAGGWGGTSASPREEALGRGEQR